MATFNKYESIKAEELYQSPQTHKSQAGYDKYDPINVEALLSVGSFLKNTHQLTELLQADEDWKNIQDIIRITIKELADVVRAQGDTVRELEKQMTFKVANNYNRLCTQYCV